MIKSTLARVQASIKSTLAKVQVQMNFGKVYLGKQINMICREYDASIDIIGGLVKSSFAHFWLFGLPLNTSYTKQDN